MGNSIFVKQVLIVEYICEAHDLKLQTECKYFQKTDSTADACLYRGGSYCRSIEARKEFNRV